MARLSLKSWADRCLSPERLQEVLVCLWGLWLWLCPLASRPELLPFVQSPRGALGVRSLESPHGPAATEPAGALRKQCSQGAMAAVSSPVPQGPSAPAGLCSELGAGFSPLGAALPYKPGKGVGGGVRVV